MTIGEPGRRSFIPGALTPTEPSEGIPLPPRVCAINGAGTTVAKTSIQIQAFAKAWGKRFIAVNSLSGRTFWRDAVSGDPRTDQLNRSPSNCVRQERGMISPYVLIAFQKSIINDVQKRWLFAVTLGKKVSVNGTMELICPGL